MYVCMYASFASGSPAALAGMHKLDYLTSVNGQSVFKLAYKQVVQILKDVSILPRSVLCCVHPEGCTYLRTYLIVLLSVLYVHCILYSM